MSIILLLPTKVLLKNEHRYTLYICMHKKLVSMSKLVSKLVSILIFFLLPLKYTEGSILNLNLTRIVYIM